VRDVILLAAGAMSDRKVRAALTIIGIIIGPATIVALVGATQGFSNASAAQFEKVGATTIFVSSSIDLTQADLSEIQGLQGVSAVVPYDQLSGSIDVAGTPQGVQIIATDIAALEKVLPSLSLEQGSIPSASAVTDAVVGASVANPGVSGATNLALNKVITVSQIQAQNTVFSIIGGGAAIEGSRGPSSGAQAPPVTRSFVVTGVYNPFGQGFAINPDSTIFVPLAVAQDITHVYTYRNVLVQASSAKLVTQVASEIMKLFGSGKVFASTVNSILSIQQSVSQGTSTLLETVAGISVLVAFIGIMTSMFTSVLERTKEIGIMKALGASGRNIMLTFLSEALLTGFVGGIGGAGAGSGLSFLVVILLKGSGTGGPSGPTTISNGGTSSPASPSLAITPSITPELILFAIVLASVVGMLAGIYPAWRASKLPPVDALRSA